MELNIILNDVIFHIPFNFPRAQKNPTIRPLFSPHFFLKHPYRIEASNPLFQLEFVPPLSKGEAQCGCQTSMEISSAQKKPPTPPPNRTPTPTSIVTIHLNISQNYHLAPDGSIHASYPSRLIECHIHIQIHTVISDKCRPLPAPPLP